MSSPDRPQKEVLKHAFRQVQLQQLRKQQPDREGQDDPHDHGEDQVAIAEATRRRAEHHARGDGEARRYQQQDLCDQSAYHPQKRRNLHPLPFGEIVAKGRHDRPDRQKDQHSADDFRHRPRPDLRIAAEIGELQRIGNNDGTEAEQPRRDDERDV